MAYSAAPLQNWEHGAGAFNLGDDTDVCVFASSSAVVVAGHSCRRDGLKPWGRRTFWWGWEVVGNHPKPTWHMPMRRDTATAGVLVCGAVVLLGEPAIEPDVPFPALECCRGKATPGLLSQVSTNGVLPIPKLELAGNSIDSLHHLWMFISKSWVCRHGKCQTLANVRQTMASCQGGAPPHRW